MVSTIALGILLALAIIFLGPWIIGAIVLAIGIILASIYDLYLWIRRKIRYKF